MSKIIITKIIAAVVAIGLVGVTAAPSFAFDSKTFWQLHSLNLDAK